MQNHFVSILVQHHCLIGGPGLWTAPFPSGKAPTKHAAEPRDHPCSRRVGAKGRVRVRVVLGPGQRISYYSNRPKRVGVLREYICKAVLHINNRGACS